MPFLTRLYAQLHQLIQGSQKLLDHGREMLGNVLHSDNSEPTDEELTLLRNEIAEMNRLDSLNADADFQAWFETNHEEYLRMHS